MTEGPSLAMPEGPGLYRHAVEADCSNGIKGRGIPDERPVLVAQDERAGEAENPVRVSEDVGPALVGRDELVDKAESPVRVSDDAKPALVARDELADKTVVVVSGPGGAGKGTIVQRMLARNPKLWVSRSWTTRPRRPGEPTDAYRFVDRETFETAIAAGCFLEWVEFLDYLLGTPVPDPPEGCDVVLEIDVGGGRQIKQLLPHVVMVFVDTPSVDEQRARMTGRGDPADTIAARLAKSESERVEAVELGYAIVVNDELSSAVRAIEDLIAADRRRRLIHRNP